eukprot:5913161-Karenia_brevis.AAC.1
MINMIAQDRQKLSKHDGEDNPRYIKKAEKNRHESPSWPRELQREPRETSKTLQEANTKNNLGDPRATGDPLSPPQTPPL